MSGIVGLLHLDGAPVERTLLDRLTQSLAFRGPDAQCSRVMGHAGLGHALLRLNDGAEPEQPFTLDGELWIVADARIDARADLAAALQPHATERLDHASDVELILRAYRAWGEECVTRLLGDFTFAIWDTARRRLFCARDHLGVKPLFYAEVGRCVVVSNTLDCVRKHPLVSRSLDDRAIGDFLLFGALQEADATSFRDIRRLPPAHSISWSADTTRRTRYWVLPVDEPLVFARSADYTDRFVELLRNSVGDRLRTRRTAVLMSGGVDSTTLAAVAASVQRERGMDVALRAITSTYERLIPDPERHYASLAAKHVGIPISFDVRDDEISIADWDRVHTRTPEPVDNPPAFAAGVEFLRKMGADARVFLYGEGPDNALKYEWRPYLGYLVAQRRFAALARALAEDVLMHPRLPFWSSIRQMASAKQKEERWRERFPDWLTEEFAMRYGARARWDAFQRPASSSHPIRPSGYDSFKNPRWQQMFGDCDTQGAIAHAEFRHPFLDVRLLQYLLSLPSMPWCRNKLIIRRAMRGTLPREILSRRKTSMGASPDLARVAAHGFPRLRPAPELAAYVNADRVPAQPASVAEFRSALRPLGLNYWLATLAG
jgi:asparagine synthase (glutamine-hydrolysing)